MTKDQLIQRIIATGDERLAKAMYNQASEIFTVDVSKALRAINARWHTQYHVATLSQVRRAD